MTNIELYIYQLSETGPNVEDLDESEENIPAANHCYANVWLKSSILTTSNVTGAIDIAFIDRADIEQYIGPPSMQLIYYIKININCIFCFTERFIKENIKLFHPQFLFFSFFFVVFINLS